MTSLRCSRHHPNRTPYPPVHPAHTGTPCRRRRFRPGFHSACFSNWNCSSTPAPLRRVGRSRTCSPASSSSWRGGSLGGNHGAAVAYAAMRLAVPATIFVPDVASPEKIERIRGYGAKLVVTGDRYADALAASEHWAAESGALGRACVRSTGNAAGPRNRGAGIRRAAPQMDTLLVAVGGGGLIGGVAAWYSGPGQDCRRRTRGRADSDERVTSGPAGR